MIVARSLVIDLKLIPNINHASEGQVKSLRPCNHVYRFGSKEKACLFLASRVVNFSKEVLFFVVRSVLTQPKVKDEPVANEHNTQETNIVNTIPFAGSDQARAKK